jgi:hypothetical protein
MKALIETESDGIQALCFESERELIAPVQVVRSPAPIRCGCRFYHPTLPEGLIPLFSSVPAKVKALVMPVPEVVSCQLSFVSRWSSQRIER